MSYEFIEGFKNQWSPCSKNDFQAHYTYAKEKNEEWWQDELWCMPPAPNACSVTCKQGWIGDGFCDDENNVAECQFDGGDCDYDYYDDY